jgi:hypothetical protein
MTVRAISPSLAAPSDALLDESASPDGTPLPLSGWRLRRRVQPNGRAVIEIADETDDLIGLITSTHLPILSVDAAWRGRAYLADGTRQWWALAIGHAPAGDDEPAVTFTRRLGARGNPRRTVVRPSRLQGLWIAAVPGLHTTVSCRQGPEQRIRRLAPAPRLHAHA